MKHFRENENKLSPKTLSNTYFIEKTGTLYSDFSDLIDSGKLRVFHSTTTRTTTEMHVASSF